jgi:ribosomal protein S11
MKQKSEKLKIKKIKKIAGGRGCLCIYSGFNNTSITITRENGDKLTQPISARTATGYKGAKKVTTHAVQIAARAALAKANEFGISTVIVKTRGVGGG